VYDVLENNFELDVNVEEDHQV
jgi:hypothetical protein